MERETIIKKFLQSDMFKKWHWFQYHFQGYLLGGEHVFAKSIVDTLCKIWKIDSKYAIQFIDRIASISGKERHLDHYEQLIQCLAELYVIGQAISYFKNDDVYIKFEPYSSCSLKNPEFSIEFDDIIAGIEVKAPSILKHIKIRETNAFQVSTRVDGLLDSIKDVFDCPVTLPRDNVVKDFLISANEKFEGFKKENKKYIGLLFIVWDDFIFEPISALLGNPSGLLLDGSFAQKDGVRIKFENVDAVIIDRHLINIMNASSDKHLLYEKRHAMDYGDRNIFPWKVIIPIPESTNRIPQKIIDCFQAVPCVDELGAEYIPSDFIQWYWS